MTTDVLIVADSNNEYDLVIDDNGDFSSGDFFDSSLLYSIFGERRALASEVPKTSRRRGWIGNEFSDFENGSGLWLYEQPRLTRTILNGIEDESLISLQWFLDDDFAIGTLSAQGVVSNSSVGLNIEIQRPNSEVEQRYFELWRNTGISSNGT